MKLHILFLSFINCISQYFPVYIALKQRNTDIIEKELLERSNPLHENYGKWYSKDKITSIVSPSIAEQNLVLEWLDLYDIHSKYNYGDSIKFYATKNIIEDILTKDINLKYKIPLHLENTIEFIEFSTKVYNKKHMKNMKSNNILVDNRYVGRDALLNIYNYTNEPLHNLTSGGVIEYQNNAGFLESDLNLDRSVNNENDISNYTVRGANFDTDTESELDIQLLSNMADGINLWYWNTPNWLYSFAVDFLISDTIPSVISMSWGWDETDQCSIFDCISNNITNKEYVNRVNIEYIKILLRGTTITASSGDAGAPGRTSEGCNPNRPLNPIFPGSSPWVLSVGATFIKNTNSSINFTSSICANNSCVEGTDEYPISYEYTGWTAGGGFSVYNNAQYWQQSAINSYVNSGVPLPDSKYYNINGRAYPDISMVGHSCPTYENGYVSGVDGTSCSSPLIAGVISILNDHQLRHNKSTFGFINPLLYKLQQDCNNCFNDIIEGHNWCTESECCNNTEIQYGFESSEGYDPVSGIGTPNIGNILTYLNIM
jgi:tripeptidyl-peptidase-1